MGKHRGDSICLPNQVLEKQQDTCLPMGGCELIPYFVCDAFAVLIKLSLSSSMSLFAFLLSCPHPTREGSEREAG